MIVVISKGALKGHNQQDKDAWKDHLSLSDEHSFPKDQLHEL